MKELVPSENNARIFVGICLSMVNDCMKEVVDRSGRFYGFLQIGACVELDGNIHLSVEEIWSMVKMCMEEVVDSYGQNGSSRQLLQYAVEQALVVQLTV
jgi:hypothetical protein